MEFISDIIVNCLVYQKLKWTFVSISIFTQFIKLYCKKTTDSSDSELLLAKKKKKQQQQKEQYLLVDGLKSSKSSKISQSNMTIEYNILSSKATMEAAVGIKASAATALTSSSGSSSPALQAGRTYTNKSWSNSCRKVTGN